jgi:CBS domain containing-hemolysin-like protein
MCTIVGDIAKDNPQSMEDSHFESVSGTGEVAVEDVFNELGKDLRKEADCCCTLVESR